MATVQGQSIPLQRVAMLASGTVTANRLVKLSSTAGSVLHTTAITEEVFGVAQETVATGKMTTVEIGNGAIVKLVASAQIVAGAALMPAAADGGKVTTRAGTTAVTVGYALEAASGDGAVFTAIFRPAGLSPVVS